MLKILCVSDLHGKFPYLYGTYDLVLIAGDILSNSMPGGITRKAHTKDIQDFTKFLKRLNEISGAVVGIGGNHDLLFEADPELPRNFPWIYLCNDEVVIDGIRIYGSPANFRCKERDYRFHKAFASWPNGEDYVANKLSNLKQCHILLTHQPAYGILDETYYSANVGSKAIYNKILEIEPNLVVCGHIHEAAGTTKIGNTKIVNAACSTILTCF